MSLPVSKPTRAQVLKGVARFGDLRPVSTGLPDMAFEDCRRSFYSVLGFEQPTGEAENSPFGSAVVPKIGHLAPGFGMAYVAAAPGKGVLMHNHDTNETFVVVQGTWKLEWEGADGDEHVLLEPLDVISFPPGMQRRFECVTAGPGRDEGLLLGVIQGDKPVAEYSPAAQQRLAAAGLPTA